MASILKHLRSSTADKRPTASGLADGQIAINTASGTPALFFKNNAGGIVKVGPAHTGTTAPNVSPAGSAGNSTGEFWIDENLTTRGLKYYDGATFVNLTPSGTSTTVGLVELATDAETQTGTDATRAVTPSGLQSKISDSTSTTSSITIASSTAVKSAYDLANAALPKAGGTLTGELLISPSGSLVFEGSSDDSFETTIAVANPTADRTITFPNVTGNVVTTGDSGTVTSTMIADGTIVDADINAAAAITHSKLANITAGSVLLGNASNVPTATALSGDVTVNSSGVTAISAGVIVNADINASAAIVDTKLDTISTADKVSLSALNIDGATDIGGALENGDLFVVDDGAGGTNRKAQAFRMAQLTYSGVTGDITVASGGTAAISAGVIVNADVNASAAIAGTKISPDFGSQNVATTGTSTAASFIPTSSTVPTNGVYLPSANNVAISTNGTGRLFVDASGNVGVGNNSQTSYNGAADNLVIGSSGSNGMTIVSSSTGAGYIMFADGTTGQQAYEGQITYDHTNNYLALNTSGSERLRITSAGLVGIGTSSPSAALDARGSASAVTEIVRIGNGTKYLGLGTEGTNYSWIQSFASTPLYINPQGNNTILNSGGGNVGVGTSSPDRQLTIAGAAVSGTQVHINSTSSSAGIKFSPSSGDAYEIQSGTDSKFSLYNRTDEAYRITVDGAGNVGVGTTSPGFKFDVKMSGSARTDGLVIRRSDNDNHQLGLWTSGGLMYFDAVTDNTGTPGQIAFRRSDNTGSSFSESMRVDSSGRLLVGTSSGSDNNALLKVQGNVGGSTGTGWLDLRRGLLTPGSGSQLGLLSFSDSSGNNYAFIDAYVDATPGTNDYPGRLVFSTTADGASSPTERMRIPNGGGLSVGTTVSPSAVNQQTAIRIGTLNVSQTTISNLTTTWTDITVAAGANGLAFVDVYNTSTGNQGNFLVSWRGYPANATVISSNNGTGLTINFQVSSGKLQMQTTSGTVSGAAYVWAG